MISQKIGTVGTYENCDVMSPDCMNAFFCEIPDQGYIWLRRTNPTLKHEQLKHPVCPVPESSGTDGKMYSLSKKRIIIIIIIIIII